MIEALGTGVLTRPRPAVAETVATAELALIYQSDYSDAWLSPTQRRYHMPRRSHLIFGILLTATLVVDIAVISRVASETFPAPFYLKMAYDALIVSQLSVVCIWAVLSSKKIRWVPALVAPVVAALVATTFSDDPVNSAEEFKQYLSIYGLAAAILVVILWIFRGTNYWRRRTGIEIRWRYSVAQLLVAMTVVACLAVAMRNGPFHGDIAALSILFVSSFAFLAMWSVIVWSSSLHRFIRLGAVLGVALMIGASFWLISDFGPTISIALGSHFVIQAIFLSAWLALGPILPLSAESAADSALQLPPKP